MPVFFVYLIKVNVALIVFCLGYYLVLRHLTFYTLNRVYLIVAIVFASAYPAINISNFLNRHQQLAKPVQVVVLNWQNPVQKVASIYNYWYWLQIIFWIGAFALGVRLIIQLFSLYKLHRKSVKTRLQDFDIRTVNGDINPFSFWQNIYINPAKHPSNELKAILKHEHIHVKQWHTLDILLGEISTIFYWFNPGVWFIKKAIKENLEFITDHDILKQGIDSKAYQYSLLNVNFGAQNNAIVNHFNISTIKKRIIMMNAKKSAPLNITRYVLLVPAAMLLLLIFSVSKAELKHAIVKNGNVVLNALNTAAYNAGFKSKPTTPARNNIVLKNVMHKTDTIPKKAVKADTGKHLTVKIIRKDGEEPEYYINGKKSTQKQLNKLMPNEIATIDVKKNSNTGKIYITTKNHTTTTSKSVDTIRLTNPEDATTIGNSNKQLNTAIIKKDSLSTFSVGTGQNRKTVTRTYSYTVKDGDTITNSKPAHNIIKANPAVSKHLSIATDVGSPKIDFKDKLIYIDGKEATASQLKKLSAANIASMSVVKGSTAIEKYGDKGKNGVIIITTKKQN